MHWWFCRRYKTVESSYQTNLIFHSKTPTELNQVLLINRFYTVSHNTQFSRWSSNQDYLCDRDHNSRFFIFAKKKIRRRKKQSQIEPVKPIGCRTPNCFAPIAQTSRKIRFAEEAALLSIPHLGWVVCDFLQKLIDCLKKGP